MNAHPSNRRKYPVVVHVFEVKVDNFQSVSSFNNIVKDSKCIFSVRRQMAPPVTVGRIELKHEGMTDGRRFKWRVEACRSMINGRWSTVLVKIAV